MTDHHSPDPFQAELFDPDPSPPDADELRRRCWEIQKEWSRRERAKRAGFEDGDDRWMPPVVSVCETD